MSIRDLSRHASAVIDRVARSGRPALVTKHGKTVAAVIPFNEGELEDYILARAPEFAQELAEANAELAAGKTVPAASLYAELDL